MLHRQLGKTTLRWLRGIRNTLLVALALFFLPSLLLLLPSMQRRAGGWLAESLSSALGVPVELGRVDVSLWTRLEADDFVIRGDDADTIVSARRLQLGLSLWESIRRGQWHVSSMQLFAPRLRIVEDTTSQRLNITPILEALSSGEGESDLALSVGAVVLREGDVQYLRGNEEVLRAQDLHLRLGRLSITPSGYSAFVDELSGRLANGFRLTRLTAALSGWGDYLRIENLRLSLPQSILTMPLARLNLAERGLGLLDTLRLEKLDFSLGDVSAFAPRLIETLPSARLVGSASLERTRGGDLYTALALSGGRALSLSTSGSIGSDTAGCLARLTLVVDSLSVGAPWLAALSPLLSPSNPSVLAPLERIGRLSYRGQASWGKQESQTVTADGVLGVDDGQIDLSGRLALDALGALRSIDLKASTVGLDLTAILGKTSLVTDLAAEVDLSATRPSEAEGWRVSGAVTAPRLTALGYTYRDLALHLVTERAHEYKLRLDSQDPNALLSADLSARWDGQTLSALSGDVDVRGINPSHLALERGGASRYFAGQVRGSLSSLDLNTATGSLSIPTLMMVQQADTLLLSDLNLHLATDRDERHIQLSAPWLSLDLRGRYSPAELPSRIIRSLYQRVPILRSLSPVSSQRKDNEATLSLMLSAPPRHFDKLLSLPLVLHEPLHLFGRYEERSDKLFVSLGADSLSLGARHLGGLRLTLEDNSLDIEGNARLFSGGTLAGFKVGMRTLGDALSLRCDLGRDDLGQENGVIDLNALLSGAHTPVRSIEDLRAEIDLRPSRLRIHSAIWDLAPAHISVQSSRLAVDNLQLSTEGRSLRLFGALGGVADGLWADLENINLRYILESAGVDFTMIETDLTGRAHAALRGGILYADAKVTSPHFHLEGRDAAAIDIALDWNSRDMKLNLGGIVRQDSLGGSAHVGGHIKLDEPAGIDLHFDATRLNIGFTHVFMQDILSRLEGAATGQVRLFGRFERGVTLSGEAFVEGGRFGLGIIGTEYGFSDRVRLEPNKIIFDHLRIHDDEGGRGVIDGYVQHDHFSDFILQLRGKDLDRLCILRTRSNRHLPIYGTAYASGTASLVGNDQHLTLGLDVQSEAKTDVTLDFNTVQVGRDVGLMRFKRLRPSASAPDSLPPAPESIPLGISMNLNIDVTPEAKVAMLMGYDGSGGVLRGKALGHLAIQVPERGEATIYGGLGVVDGQYTFRLEQLAQKRFALAEGGEITFRGPIESTELDLKAIYALTANIADLDEDLLFDIKRTSVPVHCFLGLTGSIVHPKIRFGIDLPGMDVELERRVRSLLNTDDAVMRQMLYLITLGKFYTLDSFSRNSQSATNNLTSVASSALSEQLSYLLGGLSEKISIGTNIKTRNAEFSDTDIELLLSGSLFDDRLLISANVGYHDNPYLSKTYIGEFDLEYKLSKSGNLRLKGYNHYNHMYQYLRQGLTIQGLGVVFRQRFDRLSELFAPGRSRLYPRAGRGGAVTTTLIGSPIVPADSTAQARP